MTTTFKPQEQITLIIHVAVDGVHKEGELESPVEISRLGVGALGELEVVAQEAEAEGGGSTYTYLVEDKQ